MQSELKVLYVDNGTLGGSLEGVLRDFNTLEQLVGESRLELNREKSELICDDSFTRKAMLLLIPSLRVVDQDHAILLGSRIGADCAIVDVILNRLKSLETLGSRLQLLRAHDASFPTLRSHHPQSAMYLTHLAMLSSSGPA